MKLSHFVLMGNCRRDGMVIGIADCLACIYPYFQNHVSITVGDTLWESHTIYLLVIIYDS